MDAHAAEMAEIAGVTEAGVVSPNLARELGLPIQLVSDDGEVAFSALTFNFGKNGWQDIPDAADEIREITEVDGVTVHLAGFGGQAADASEAFEGIDSTLIGATFLVVIIILLFTYRSPILWLLPIISAAVAYTISGGVVYLLAKYADLTVNGQSQSILGILVIGAGTDYALLLVARYREELRRHEDRHEAMAFALHRAAPAVLASAATVVVGLLCLFFADLNSTAGLGPVLAVGVAVTFLVMVTLLPALLVIFGRWMFWPKRPTFGPSSPPARACGPSSASASPAPPQRCGPSPRACCSSPAWACSSSTRPACRPRTLHQGVRLDQGPEAARRARSARQLQHRAGGRRHRRRSRRECAVVASTASATRPSLRTSGTVAPSSRPRSSADVSSTAAFDIVEAARDVAHAVDGGDALVGGGSAFYLDTKIASDRDNKVIIPIVLLVVFLILMLLLRALVAPLLLMGTVVLSFGAALGISTLLFRGVHQDRLFESRGFAHTDPGFPLFAFVFLVALGIDYNIFLMTTSPRGDGPPRHPPGIADRPVVHGWRDHLRRPGARGHLPGARVAAAGVPRRARRRGRARGLARHDDRALGARDRAQPRPRRQDLVAEQARRGPVRRTPPSAEDSEGAGAGLTRT